MYVTSGAQGEGFATVASDGGVLDAWFLNLKLTPGGAKAGTQRVTGLSLPGQSADDVARYARKDDIRGVEVVPIRTEIACLADKPVDVHDVYLRLHLLSHRLVKPNAVNIDGMFQLLPSVAWTTLGPCPLETLDATRIRARLKGVALDVCGIDKIPRMTDYVVPSGVRIADAGRVRLGAYLAAGTIVMHEGFCNFNAGTLGTCMVEGRISAGVVVGHGSDVGGGASIMGTLSGGGKVQVVGR